MNPPGTARLPTEREAYPVAPLVIIGASARAVAQSAARCGWSVHAADLFGDLDLVAAARETVAVGIRSDPPASTAYPWSLRDAAARFPAGAAWCYTGALENHPDLIAAIAATRPLAGCPADAVRRLRAPRTVAAAAAAAGLASPECFASPAGLPRDGTFLVKPVASAGGRGIRPWTSQAAVTAADSSAATGGPARLWQRFVAGAPWSATFLFQSGEARLVGVARQLVGAGWCRAAPFAWCGAVVAPAPLAAAVARLGDPLAALSGGVGLVGVDVVVDDAGRVHVIEVNPRPTASMELFERAFDWSLACAHLAACGIPSPRPPVPRPAAAAAAVWSKAVLFARRDVCVDEDMVAGLRQASDGWTAADGGWPSLADLPRPGPPLAAGAAVLTVFARGPAPAESLVALRCRVTAVEALLERTPEPMLRAAPPGITPPSAAASSAPPPPRRSA